MIKINIDVYYNEYEFILNILIIIISFIFLLKNILVLWNFYIDRNRNEDRRDEIQIQRNNIRNIINVRPWDAYINNYIENQDNNNIVHRVDQIDDNNNNIIIKDNFKNHIIVILII